VIYDSISFLLTMTPNQISAATFNNMLNPSSKFTPITDDTST